MVKDDIPISRELVVWQLNFSLASHFARPHVINIDIETLIIRVSSSMSLLLYEALTQYQQVRLAERLMSANGLFHQLIIHLSGVK